MTNVMTQGSIVTISVYVGYLDVRCLPTLYLYVGGIILFSALINTLINTPPPTEGVIISQTIFRFLGVIFDGDHGFEGPRSPKSHLDTVLRKPVTPPALGTPRM